MSMLSIYFAGPDLFDRGRWPGHTAEIRRICASLHVDPVFPVADTPISGLGVDKPGSSRDASAIRDACLRAIDRVDGVIVNLTPFRGAEPDSGSVVEATYAVFVKGLPTVGYIDWSDPRVDVREMYGPDGKPMVDDDGVHIDRHGRVIEQFGLPINLMIATSVHALIEGHATREPLLHRAIEAVRALTLGQAPDRAHRIGHDVYNIDAVAAAGSATDTTRLRAL